MSLPADECDVVVCRQVCPVKAANRARPQDNDLHGSHRITRARRRETALIYRGGLVPGDRLKDVDLSERGPGFVGAAHLFQDVGKEEILPGLVGLARHGAALNFAGRVEMILLHVECRDQVERFSIVNVEPARVAKGGFCFCGIARFRIKLAEDNEGAGMPPIRVCKFLHEWQRGAGRICLSQHFGFETNQGPGAGIIDARFFQDRARPEHPVGDNASKRG